MKESKLRRNSHFSVRNMNHSLNFLNLDKYAMTIDYGIVKIVLVFITGIITLQLLLTNDSLFNRVCYKKSVKP